MNGWKPQFHFSVCLISESRKWACYVIWVWAVCMATYSSIKVVPIWPMSVTVRKKKNLRKGIWNDWQILNEFHNLTRWPLERIKKPIDVHLLPFWGRRSTERFEVTLSFFFNTLVTNTRSFALQVYHVVRNVSRWKTYLYCLVLIFWTNLILYLWSGECALCKGRGGIAPLILNLGDRRWVTGCISRPLQYLFSWPGTWEGLGANVDV